MHTYDYDTAEARVIVEGLTSASGFARRVGLDAQGRLLTDTDATDQTTTYAYDTGNRVVSVIDPAGRMSTAVHDDGVTRSHPSGRRSHSYGPALEDCFTGLVPDNTCTDPPPPHTATTYDTEVVTGTALTGLAAAYWEDRALLGLPKNHGPADPASLTSVDPPAAGLGAGAWSARYSGELSLDETSTAADPHGFSLVLTGRGRLFIDDTLVVDGWVDHGSAATVAGTFANGAVGRHRFRVDYATQSGVAPSLQVRWAAPGGADTALAASKVAPRYSMPTASVSDDTTVGVASRAGDVIYAAMANGLVTEATADRAGLAVVTTTSYETAGYLRPVTRTLGAGAATATTYEYYAAAAAPLSSGCAGAATNQGRALKRRTGADPDGAGAGTALVSEYVYDALGRMVGSHRNTEATWTCVAYDTRGRVSSVAIPAFGVEPARTVSHSYVVALSPLRASVTDPAGTIAATVDLLGRTVSYTDVWNKTTTSTYDQAGRLTRTVGPAGDVEVVHDDAGRVERQSLDSALMAEATYADGELASCPTPPPSTAATAPRCR